MKHSELFIWKLAMNIVNDIYVLTSQFPDSEKYCLSQHLKRTVVSIPSNIAEGAGRKNTKELLNFINISMGSLAELETQLIIAKDQEYLTEKSVIFNKIKILRAGLHRLSKKLSNPS